MSTYNICLFCQNFHGQPLGKVVEKVNETSGVVNYAYKTAQTPTCGTHCEECGSYFHVGTSLVHYATGRVVGLTGTQQIAGPMWSGPIHEKAFAKEVLDLVSEKPEAFGTHARMQGMLSVASEELDLPFYFTPSKIASAFHSEAPPLVEIA